VVFEKYERRTMEGAAVTIAGKIAHYTANGRRAALDSQTAIWAGRMLVGEGYKQESGPAVLWSTMYRFLGMPHDWGSYKNLIRAFSQPINPKWIPGGALYEKYKNSQTEVYKRATSDTAVARRKRIQAMEWTELPIEVQQLVGKFAIGELPPPAAFNGLPYSNFASYTGVDQKYPGGKWIGGNYFFVDPDVNRNLRVQIEHGAGTPIEQLQKKNSGIADIALLGVGIWLIWRFFGKG
jgi:hypothetical protein